MRHTVRTHVLIRLHPMSAADALLPRLNATKHLPPLSSHVSHKFAFTPKAKHNSERAQVCSRSTSCQLVWGQRVPPS